MDNNQELLTILMEECAEVTVEASKIIRFEPSRYDNLTSELGDLYCMIELLCEAGHTDWQQITMCAEAKREKLKKWSNLNV